jgi:hypothetical protein
MSLEFSLGLALSLKIDLGIVLRLGLSLSLRQQLVRIAEALPGLSPTAVRVRFAFPAGLHARETPARTGLNFAFGLLVFPEDRRDDAVRGESGFCLRE